MGKCTVTPLATGGEIEEWVHVEVYNDGQSLRNDCVLPLLRVNGKRYAFGIMTHVRSDYRKIKATYHGRTGVEGLYGAYVYTKDGDGAYATAIMDLDGVERPISYTMRSGSVCFLRVSE